MPDARPGGLLPSKAALRSVTTIFEKEATIVPCSTPSARVQLRASLTYCREAALSPSPQSSTRAPSGAFQRFRQMTCRCRQSRRQALLPLSKGRGIDGGHRGGPSCPSHQRSRHPGLGEEASRQQLCIEAADCALDALLFWRDNRNSRGWTSLCTECQFQILTVTVRRHPCQVAIPCVSDCCRRVSAARRRPRPMWRTRATQRLSSNRWREVAGSSWRATGSREQLTAVDCSAIRRRERQQRIGLEQRSLHPCDLLEFDHTRSEIDPWAPDLDGILPGAQIGDRLDAVPRRHHQRTPRRRLITVTETVHVRPPERKSSYVRSIPGWKKPVQPRGSHPSASSHERVTAVTWQSFSNRRV